MIKTKMAFFSLVTAVAVSATALSLAEAAKPAAEAAKETAKEPPKQQPAAQQRPAPMGIHPVAQAAASAGAVECMGQINQLSSGLTANAKSGAFLFTSPTEGARRLTSVSFEVNAQNTLAYSSASFAPVVGGGCQALYEAVVYWEKPCGEVAKAAFSTLKPAKVIMKDIEVLADAKTLLRVFLMPAGKGCVSIKKDVLY
jgi:hypothetical protein